MPSRELDQPRAGRATIVLVDDDVHLLRSMERLLQDSFDVIACEFAGHALDEVQRGGVSVVLSDIAMPGMDGIDLLRAIRNRDPDLPVILITGAPTLDTATQAIEYGVFRYLPKPFDKEVVLRTVEQASRLYRLARMKREALELQGQVAGASDRVGLEVTFQRALESLWVAVQPIVSVSGKSVFGYEALMRSADAAMPSPLHLLGAAERLDALETLGRSIRRCVAEIASRAGGDTLLLVNLHPKDLLDPELSELTSPLVAIADRVVLEITERASLGGLDDVQERVASRRQLGYRIAIDDLGAGYAGLTSFALLEPEIVKLDMTLTRDIDKSSVKQKLVGSLVGLCRGHDHHRRGRRNGSRARRAHRARLRSASGIPFRETGPPVPGAGVVRLSPVRGNRDGRAAARYAPTRRIIPSVTSLERARLRHRQALGSSPLKRQDDGRARRAGRAPPRAFVRRRAQGVAALGAA